MSDNEEQKSFLGRQWEAFKLVDDAVRNKSLIKDFDASDPVHGAIVKAAEETRNKAHIGTGIIIFGGLLKYGWKLRRRFTNDIVGLVAVLTLPPLAVRCVVDLGINSYLLQQKDQRAAYVKFNEWLRKRA